MKLTPGLFLLGLYAGRKRFFDELPSHLQRVKKYLRNSAWCLLGCVLSGIAFFMIGNSITGGLSQDINIAAGVTFFDIFNTFLAMIYMAWFILLFQKEKWKNRLMHFYAAGRMGLTTYLMQAFFGILIFSTIGLGFLGALGAATCFIIAIGIFVIQILISKFWLKYFYYGPVEWIWRCLTNFKIYPFVKTRTEILSVTEAQK